MSFNPTPEQIAEHDRRNRAVPPITAPLAWGHAKDPLQVGRVLAQSEAIIARVLRETHGQAAIDISLALGGACTRSHRRRIAQSGRPRSIGAGGVKHEARNGLPLSPGSATRTFLRGCTICKMPLDLRRWEDVVLCPVIREWLDLYFPESPRNPEVNEARSATIQSPAPPEGQPRAESAKRSQRLLSWEKNASKPTPEGEKP